MSRSFNIFFVIILVLISSCDKEQRTKKKLAGSWNIIEYQYSNFSGLTYRYDTYGQMTFENCEDALCNYAIDMYFINQGDTSYRNDNGYYELIKGSDNYILYKMDSSGITDTLDNGRIILLTKKSLKIEFTEFYQRHLFILERIN